MEELPSELCLRVLSLLEYRQLACLALVSRNLNWKSGQDELWRTLYVQRWGQDEAARVVLNAWIHKAWKSAFEVQDRCDRIGMGMTIVREGRYYYIVHKGVLVHLLGALTDGAADEKHSELTSIPRNKLVTGDTMKAGEAAGSQQSSSPDMQVTGDSVSKRPRAGLFDRMLIFAAEMDHELRLAKCLTSS